MASRDGISVPLLLYLRDSGQRNLRLRQQCWVEQGKICCAINLITLISAFYSGMFGVFSPQGITAETTAATLPPSHGWQTEQEGFHY
jgi:hypothetical protein